MKDFVATSDGMVGFKKSEYRLHSCNIFNGIYELIIWTNGYPDGRIVKYLDKEDRDKAAKEVYDQLINNYE